MLTLFLFSAQQQFWSFSYCYIFLSGVCDVGWSEYWLVCLILETGKLLGGDSISWLVPGKSDHFPLLSQDRQAAGSMANRKRTFWSRIVVEMVFHSEDRHRSRTPILLRKIREDWVSKIDPCRSATSNFKIGEVLRCDARFKLADIVSAGISHVKVLYRVNLTFKRFRGYQSTFILLD